MLIAKHGNYTIEHETFLGRRNLTTHAVVINKHLHDGSIHTVCKLSSDLNIVSIQDRLISSIDTFEDVVSLKILTRLLYNIYETEEVEIE